MIHRDLLRACLALEAADTALHRDGWRGCFYCTGKDGHATTCPIIQIRYEVSRAALAEPDEGGGRPMAWVVVDSHGLVASDPAESRGEVDNLARQYNRFGDSGEWQERKPFAAIPLYSRAPVEKAEGEDDGDAKALAYILNECRKALGTQDIHGAPEGVDRLVNYVSALREGLGAPSPRAAPAEDVGRASDALTAAIVMLADIYEDGVKSNTFDAIEKTIIHLKRERAALGGKGAK